MSTQNEENACSKISLITYVYDYMYTVTEELTERFQWKKPMIWNKIIADYIVQNHCKDICTWNVVGINTLTQNRQL